MINTIFSLFRPTPKQIVIRILKGQDVNTVNCSVGSNLMDVTNSLVNQNVNIYGLCDKQLACTTCRVDIQTLASRLPPPSDEELDVLLTTKDYRQQTSRMACQITLTEDLDGMTIRIPADKAL